MAVRGVSSIKMDKKDIFGTLNLLTPDVVKAAAAEVQRGISVFLDPGFYPSRLTT